MIKAQGLGAQTLRSLPLSKSPQHANQPIPQRNNPPWAYSDIEQDLLLLAQPLPARWGTGHTLTVEQPVIALHGTWALVTQRLFYI